MASAAGVDKRQAGGLNLAREGTRMRGGGARQWWQRLFNVAAKEGRGKAGVGRWEAATRRGGAGDPRRGWAERGSRHRPGARARSHVRQGRPGR
jgi:hypothetical protein